MEAEAEADERNGWERYTLDDVVETVTLNHLPKRGRPRKEPEYVNDGG